MEHRNKPNPLVFIRNACRRENSEESFDRNGGPPRSSLEQNTKYFDGKLSDAKPGVTYRTTMAGEKRTRRFEKKKKLLQRWLSAAAARNCTINRAGLERERVSSLCVIATTKYKHTTQNTRKAYDRLPEKRKGKQNRM
jgi:hypothetical protein